MDRNSGIYYEDDDILFIEFSKDKVVKDVSLSWNVNVGYTEKGIGEITILDAKKAGYSVANSNPYILKELIV